jgi:hypothetical protein
MNHQDQPVPRENASASPSSEMLHDVAAFIARYLACTSEQRIVLALWVLHTYCFSAAHSTPYLNIFSTESRCGKSVCLQVLRLLCASPWLAAGVPSSVLIRKITADRPTLLLDQRETLLGAAYTKIRGLLISGARREGTYSVSAGNKGQIADHDVFCPKAFAGDAPLPISLDPLCIPIFLVQRFPGDRLRRLRLPEAREAAQSLVLRLQQWAASNLEALKSAPPLPYDQFPEDLSSNYEDSVEPLLQIANLLGGEWPLQACSALIRVFDFHTEHDDSYVVPLLSDIYDLFETEKDRRLPTGDLLEYLNNLETRPWRSWNKGGLLTARNLARLLGQVGIRSRNQRYPSGGRGNGYQYEDFLLPWQNWLPKAEKQALEVPGENDKD